MPLIQQRLVPERPQPLEAELCESGINVLRDRLAKELHQLQTFPGALPALDRRRTNQAGPSEPVDSCRNAIRERALRVDHLCFDCLGKNALDLCDHVVANVGDDSLETRVEGSSTKEERADDDGEQHPSYPLVHATWRNPIDHVEEEPDAGEDGSAENLYHSNKYDERVPQTWLETLRSQRLPSMTT